MCARRAGCRNTVGTPPPFCARTCLAAEPRQPYIGAMSLDLTDEEHTVLLRLVKHAIDEDRSPYAPRLDPLKVIMAKLAAPPQKVYAPSRATAARKRRAGQ
jgi:hypothetical protein